MNPVPASTVYALTAGAVTTIIVWALKQWGHIEMPLEVQGALTTLVTALTAHFVVDKPPTP